MFKIPINKLRRHILHIDADAFFASVEQILNPTLKGKPVLVGGPDKSHGIVSAASYEARKFGVKSAMPMYLALRKCPNAVVVSGNFQAYRDFSRRMYRILLEFTPDVEMASVDEAYLDISGCEEMHKLPASMIARRILFKIYRDLGLSVSCGLSSSKTVAKTASSINKPHKLTTVPYGKEVEFLAPLRLDKLPGIGPKTFYLLQKFGLEKIGDLSAMSSDAVMETFGIRMIPLWKKSMGIDNSRVISDAPLPKSISKEHTFYEQDIGVKLCLERLKELSVQVFQKLRGYGMKAGTIFVKIRYRSSGNSGNESNMGSFGRRDFFTDFSFQEHVGVPSNVDKELFPLVKALFLKNFHPEISVRLIGIGVTNLKKNYNLDLFADRRHEKLFSSLDKVREIYGEDALKYGI